MSRAYSFLQVGDVQELIKSTSNGSTPSPCWKFYSKKEHHSGDYDYDDDRDYYVIGDEYQIFLIYQNCVLIRNDNVHCLVIVFTD